ncbi:PPIE, partial [Symbiodinium microadriaticum]
VYVGGLDSGVNEETLHAAFIPFGDIREVNIPKDFAENKHRGFGFVDFEDAEDAAAAIENMNGAELFGKVLKCNMAKPMTKLQPGQAVWTAEEWLSNSLKTDDTGPTDDAVE